MMLVKRIATGLILLSAVVLCANAQIYGPNLVQNGNFELDAPIPAGVRILTQGSPGVGAGTAFGGNRYGELLITQGVGSFGLARNVELTPGLYRIQFAFAPSAPADRLDVIIRAHVQVTMYVLNNPMIAYLPMMQSFTWSLRDQHRGYTEDNGNAWQFIIWDLDLRGYAAVRLDFAEIQTLPPINPSWRYYSGGGVFSDGVLLDEVYFGRYYPVPEPSSLLALAVGSGGLLTRRWRRRLADRKA